MSQHPTEWILKESPDVPRSSTNPLPDILCKLLAQRGVAGEKEIEHFLRPRLRELSDPFLLPNMQAAVDRIFTAIDEQQRVCVYGDYDVDGITSVTLLIKALKAYGLEARPFIPHRGPEGYGLNEASLKRCMSEGEPPELMITVDCGTASHVEIAQLNEKGIDTIVVDHHELPIAGEPNCVAVVNPKCGDDYHYLCAAGVVFKLIHAMLKTRQLQHYDLKEDLDLVAMATISDIVPLIEENRLIVRHGLRRLANTRHIGIAALKKVAQLPKVPTSSDVGFRMGPRINAAGRMDRPEDALAMLMSEDELEAESLADQLNAHNIRRQKHELEIHNQAIEAMEDLDDPECPVIVLASRQWHPGVVGIVASRLMRRYHKPCFVISVDQEGIGKGSGRSIEGVSLVDAINNSRPLLLAGGGHEMAAGISINEDQIETFRQQFAEYVIEHVPEHQRRPKLTVDAELPFQILSLAFLESYELLQPFGCANPQPVFMSSNVWLAEPPRKLKNNHLKLSLKQGDFFHEAMYFGGANFDIPEGPLDIAFTINRNFFRGRTSLQLIIQDIRQHQAKTN